MPPETKKPAGHVSVYVLEQAGGGWKGLSSARTRRGTCVLAAAPRKRVDLRVSALKQLQPVGSQSEPEKVPPEGSWYSLLHVHEPEICTALQPPSHE